MSYLSGHASMGVFGSAAHLLGQSSYANQASNSLYNSYSQFLGLGGAQNAAASLDWYNDQHQAHQNAYALRNVTPVIISAPDRVISNRGWGGGESRPRSRRYA